ncbi:helix-turn-helix domain-containing protein [Pseudomonas kurunegalensis]|uniref:helix-turn-helix domain-containing protein n=1 Tax=Pseudomonas kurunegalensis TaxID=485880 RepID=UPI002570C883|nr:helix-turn-helix domain-containing protein [Pseudomonas kurunegalensis]WJD60692.1 helix-turn-helix domain-containing protein [Pseudomonas kurunegalensis]
MFFRYAAASADYGWYQIQIELVVNMIPNKAVSNFECVDVQAWQSLICQNYNSTDVALLDGAAVDGNLSLREFGDTSLSHIRSNPISYTSPGRASDADSFYLSLTMCRQAHVVQNGRKSLQRPGDIVFYGGGETFSCSFPEGDDQIVITVPHELMIEHVPNALSFSSRTLDGNSTLGKIVNSMIREMWVSDGLGVAVETKLSGSLLDVVSAGFESEVGELNRAAPWQVRKMERVKSYLIENLRNPMLCMDSVASDNYVSARTLNRMFAREGTTASKWLWEQRLLESQRELLAHPDKNIGDVAIEMGFRNFSHFSRAFKASFGLSPRQHRDMLLPGKKGD